MAAYTSSTITEIYPNAGLKEIVVLTPASMTTSDTLQIDLAQYGISASGLYSITGMMHSNPFFSIISSTATCTTSTTGLLTITLGGTDGAGRRCFRILGTSAR